MPAAAAAATTDYPRVLNVGHWTNAVRAWLKSDACPLTTAHRAVFLAALLHGNGSGQIRPGNAELMALAGCSEDTVTRAMRAVAAAGWLVAVAGGYGTTAVTYVRAYPAGDDSPPETPERVRTAADPMPPQGPQRSGRGSAALRQRVRTAADLPEVLDLEEHLKAARARDPEPAPRKRDPEPTPPPACPRHPAGWHHAEPCRACARSRDWSDKQRSPAERAAYARAAEREKRARSTATRDAIADQTWSGTDTDDRDPARPSEAVRQVLAAARTGGLVR